MGTLVINLLEARRSTSFMIVTIYNNNTNNNNNVDSLIKVLDNRWQSITGKRRRKRATITQKTRTSMGIEVEKTLRTCY
jgi:TPP-dependent indolepyruvate ferredoxin oxidoreductase alpha subunit